MALRGHLDGPTFLQHLITTRFITKQRRRSVFQASVPAPFGENTVAALQFFGAFWSILWQDTESNSGLHDP